MGQFDYPIIQKTETMNKIEGSTINPLYNHAHLSHILVCLSFFGNHPICLETSLSRSLDAQNICKVFFCKCEYNGEI